MPPRLPNAPLLLLALAVVGNLLATSVAPASAQEPIDRAMLARIRAEGLERSQVPELYHHLIDVLGQRLTGSPAYDRAADWAQSRFAAWGLAEARQEPFEFGRGWTLAKLSLEMTAPRYLPLIGYAEAWTPSTRGALRGTPIYLGESSLAEIEAMGDRLRGAIVLTHQPQVAFVESDRPQPTEVEGARPGNPPGVPALSATPMQQVMPVLQRLGVGAALRPSSFEHGTAMVLGNRNTTDDAVPSLVLAAEHYNTVARMARSGVPVEVALEVRTIFDEGGSTNVLAEIPGTDPALRDEVVLIGAHLDSWHTANGAIDNGDGAIGVMEAIRILQAVGARPRRTIRVALWGGEEQGLLGARSYVERYLADQADKDRLAVFLNDDPGTGATFGFFMQGNEAAKRIFDAWLEPLADLGVRRNILEGIGSTDHVPFHDAGLPGFTAVKDYTGYDSRGRHTNQDFMERVATDDLKQSAIVMAAFAWHAAQRDERIPRPVPATQGGR